VARQTRQQRRDRRAQQEQGAAGRPPAPPRRPTAADADQQPEGARRPSRAAEAPRRRPGIDFIRESWAELKKVEWPGQRQVITGTTVVLVACIIVGTYLWLNDQLWQYVVHHLLIR
jgi:preprotein translocase SecE subunit